MGEGSPGEASARRAASLDRVSRADVRTSGALGVLGAAIALVTLNLRTPVTSVGPVLDDIRHTLGMSSTAAGVLTMAPVLCYGLAAPLAPRLLRRGSAETLLFAALGLVAVGIVIRVSPSVPAVFAGTVVLGVPIAVANVLVPAVIKRDFPRPGTMMGVYSMMLGVAAALGAGLSVPLKAALGDSWRWALAVWAVPAIVAAVVWLPFMRRARPRSANPDAPPAVSLWRDRKAWMVSGFLGCQALLFYASAAWLPDVLKDHGASEGAAGALLSVMLVLGIPVSLVVPMVAERVTDQRGLAVFASGTWLAGLIGLLLSPGSAALVWMILLGVAQGAGISLALALFALRASDSRHAAAISGMAQTLGYTLAAAGPLGVGALHDATGDWIAPLVLLLVTAVAMLLFGLGAARPGFVQGTETVADG